MGSRLAVGRVGIGGWSYEAWRGTFYPDDLPHRRELEYASRQLTSIEINSTYYGSQKPATFAKWREETPDGFVFSLKAPRSIVNRKQLADAGAAIERFCAGGIIELEEKLGPINWQLMPTKAFDPVDVAAFLKLLPKKAGGRSLRHALEVRHDSFRSPSFLAMVRDHGVAVVIAGDSAYPQIADVTAPFVYARIMGTLASKKSGYTDTALQRWADRVGAWTSGAAPSGLAYVEPHQSTGKPRDVYLYVIGGHKVKNPAAAVSLRERLRRRGAGT